MIHEIPRAYRPARLLITILIALLTNTIEGSSAPAAEDLERIVARGTIVDLMHNGAFLEKNYSLLVGDRVVLRFRPPITASLHGMYEDGPDLFVLVAVPSGGSIGGGSFYILDLSDMSNPLVSEEIGYTLHLDGEPQVTAGALAFDVLDAPRTQSYKVTSQRGHSTVTATDRLSVLSGPSKPPGGDIGAFLVGRSLGSALQVRFVHDMSLKIVGTEGLELLRSVGNYSIGDNAFQVVGDYVYFSAAQAHAVQRQVSVVADHNEHIWFLLKDLGRQRIYGRPPDKVLRLLKRDIN